MSLENRTVTLAHNNESRHEQPPDDSEHCGNNGERCPFLKWILERPKAADVGTDGGEKQNEGKSLCYGNPAIDLLSCHKSKGVGSFQTRK